MHRAVIITVAAVLLAIGEQCLTLNQERSASNGALLSERDRNITVPELDGALVAQNNSAINSKPFQQSVVLEFLQDYVKSNNYSRITLLSNGFFNGK